MVGRQVVRRLGTADPPVSLHPEILSRAQRKVLTELGPTAQRTEFYLAGGTAIALHLGHRRSVDFDWFCDAGLGDPLRLAQSIRDAGQEFETGSVSTGTLHGMINRVPVSFLEYRYPLLAPAFEWAEMGCAVASLDDLACMKLSAISQRGAKKDFIDVYALCREHCSLSAMFDLYRRKYGIADRGHLLYSLAYFDDAELEPMPSMLWKVNWKTVKSSIRGWVRDLTSN